MGNSKISISVAWLLFLLLAGGASHAGKLKIQVEDDTPIDDPSAVTLVALSEDLEILAEYRDPKLSRGKAIFSLEGIPDSTTLFVAHRLAARGRVAAAAWPVVSGRKLTIPMDEAYAPKKDTPSRSWGPDWFARWLADEHRDYDLAGRIARGGQEVAEDWPLRITQPRILNKISPTYPPLKGDDRVAANVILQAVIGIDGKVRHAEVVRSSISGKGFEEAALGVLPGWLYRPAEFRGEPIEVYFTVDMRFYPR